jgi:8-oxo-dGTP diphosphatase
MVIKGVCITVKKGDRACEGLPCDEHCIRAAVRTMLTSAQRAKKRSIVLGCLVSDPSWYKPASKIAAQEVFRYIKDTTSPSLKKVEFTVSAAALAIFKKNVQGYLAHMLEVGFKGPYVTIDGIVEYKGGIVLIERTNPPFGWALPGGFLDYGETVEDGVVREIKEETNLDLSDVRLFCVRSAPERDPRFHVVTVVFSGKGRGTLRAGDDAGDARVYTRDTLPKNLIADHREIITSWLKKKNKKV